MIVRVSSSTASCYHLRCDTVGVTRLKRITDDNTIANGNNVHIQRVVDQVHVVFNLKGAVYSVDRAWERRICYAERRLPNLRFN